MIDPEDLAFVVRAVKSVAMDVVARFGGQVTQFHGDGVLAIFGYPSPREDDVQRAAEAALELHEAVRQLDLQQHLPDQFAVKLHTGIESGLVLIRQGDFLDGTLELVGDAVNTAAGLCSAAAHDEIVASAATLRSVLPFFVASEIGPLHLKGKTVPVAAFKVLRRSEIRNRFEASKLRGLTAFSGRHDEMDRLRDCLHVARSGRAQIVQIVGDPGLGKTRLVDEFTLEADRAGCLIHRGYCEQRGGVAPLHPFLQMLRNAFELNARSPAASARRLIEQCLTDLDRRLLDHSDAFFRALAVDASPTGGQHGTPGKSRPSMEVPLTDWFKAQAGEATLVVVIDDWQWVDDASRNVLGRLINAATTNRLLIVIATRALRPEDALAAPSEVIELGPLQPSESEQIIRRILPGRPVPGVLSELHRKSGGNPLFLEELCQSYPDWKDQGEDSVADGVVPATLQGLIETRVRRLPAEQVALVNTAAVVGNVIPSWLLKRLSGLDEGDEIFQKLADSDLIYAGENRGTLQFKHGITRETIYATVGLKQRRTLHGQIAQFLEELGELGWLEEHYENLAYHHAGAANHLQALRYAELAGDKAMASRALDRGKQQYEAAMRAIDKLPNSTEMQQRWVSISRRWALPCVYGPEPAQIGILKRTVDYALNLNDLDGLAEAHYWQGYISHVLGDQKESIDFYTRALAAARQANNDRLAAQLIATLGQSHGAASNYPDALKYLDQAIEEKRRHPTKSKIRVGSSYALSSKALVLGDMGDFAGSHACSDEALANVGGHGHEIESSILNNRGTVCLWQGRWHDAVEFSRRSEIIALQVSAPYLRACATAINAYGRWKLVQDSASAERLRQTIAWVEAKGMYLFSSFFYGWISDVLVAMDQFEEASEFAHRGIQRARVGDRVGEAMVYRSLATASDRGGQSGLESPEHYLTMAMRAAQERNSPHEAAITQLYQADQLARRGKTDGAAGLRAQAHAAFTRMDMPWHAAMVEPQEGLRESD